MYLDISWWEAGLFLFVFIMVFYGGIGTLMGAVCADAVAVRIRQRGSPMSGLRELTYMLLGGAVGAAVHLAVAALGSIYVW